MVTGKNILIGVCGGIAAYKAVSLVSALVKEGNRVTVAMTEAATKLVSPHTFRTVSRNPVVTDLFADHRSPVPHVALSEENDAFVIVPATANCIAKAASGIADDILSTLIVAYNRPVIFVPAMNTQMWNNRVVQDNLERLRSFGHLIVEPGTGYLACGTEGAGRLPEQDVIMHAIETLFADKDLTGRHFLITAGGTREYIDDVRMITNASTGKMGTALAEDALRRGAQVTLISTLPVRVLSPCLTTIQVDTAARMLAEVETVFPSCDVFISAAAVSDFAVANPVKGKMKKEDIGETYTIELKKTVDIVKTCAARKTDRQVVAGFCLESEDLVGNAVKKMKEKSLDLVVANAATAIGADETDIIIVTGEEKREYHGAKQQLATKINDAIKELL